MVKVIVDTNFILNCIRNKFDFYEGLLEMGFLILVPKEVIKEIQRITISSKSLKFRDEAKLALKLISLGNHQVISCPGKYVDAGIKKYLDKHLDVFLATMDKELKKSVKNRKIVLRNKKKLELQ